MSLGTMYTVRCDAYRQENGQEVECWNASDLKDTPQEAYEDAKRRGFVHLHQSDLCPECAPQAATALRLLTTLR